MTEATLMHDVLKSLGRIEAKLEGLAEADSRQIDDHDRVEKRVTTLEARINKAAGYFTAAAAMASVFVSIIVDRIKQLIS